MYSYKRKLYFLAVFTCLCILSSEAQNIGRRSNIDVTDAGRIDLLKGNNLSNISVDQLSDAQIAAIQAQLQSNGVTLEQAEQMAMAKGMSPAEWQKLRNRLSTQPRNTSQATTEPTTLPSTDRQTAANDYRVYQKTNDTPEVFGSAFFNTPSLSFEPNLRIATPINYVLGPDDEMLVNVSGYQETNLRTTVQPEGAIFIPQVGSVSVSGLTIEQATLRIREKMSSTVYPSLRNGSSKLIVSLGKIKSIHITVIGAAKPGNYTVSSLSTVFNSLYLCGGPGAINTYRDIELIRNNKVIAKIDIYQFLTRGDQKGNLPLKENDVINFPVYKKHVSIRGQVKRESIFELKEGEKLEDLIFFAGGFTDKAYKAYIRVKQVTDTERKIRDIAKSEFNTYLPANGDEFQVDAILNRIENVVAISGAVNRPGQFELTPNLTLRGLIKRAGGLQENVFTERAILTRSHADGTGESITFNVSNLLNGNVADIPLQKRDSVAIAFATTFNTNYTVEVQGEVRHPGPYAYRENLSLKDMLFAAGGFTDAASSYNVEVSRRLVAERLDKNTDSIATVFNINTAKELSIENNRFILQPYDIVTVRRNPGYTAQQRVSINGEVNFPGTYTIQSRKERISDLISRSGGLTSQAYAKGVFLIRNSLQTDTVNRASIRNIQNSIKDTSTKVLDDLTRTNNRIAVNLKKVMEEPGSIENYVLQDGDMVQVLRIDPLVKVSGEVLAATQTGYRKGKSLKYYLSQAGGTTDNARRSKIYVVHANGNIGKTNNGIWGLFRSYPKVEEGGEIVVPRKIERKGLSTTETIGLTSAVLSLVSLIIVTISNIK
ncbi:SLBB domain-containing protein [Mucilaginibacter sp. Bleaf8]|uniref:SLBB domain-containing protein n=1 Tax=Mucilaginibacter sp. Bleaf8 TaxID=2834430 RepID=UPI001BCC128E|nr:SLBB domain-containing protein [Mucilaginibacter sp. Bleaf8]MBS7563850.1 SLBB domain-containing protein [Mucilaginibacter sp. Bleaf8]